MKRWLCASLALIFYMSLLPWAGADYFNYRAHDIASDGGNITGFDNITNTGYGGTQRTGDLITKGPWVDVRAYGAVANDNTKGTVNTAAFQAASDYLKTLGGGRIIAPGNYRLGSKVTLYNSTILSGTGMESTVLSAAFSGTVIEISYFLHGGDYETAGTFVENLTITGIDNANGGIGISVLDKGNTLAGTKTTRQSGINNVRLTNLTTGLEINASQDFSSINSQFRNNTYGVYYNNDDITLGGVAQLVRFDGCDFRSNLYGVTGIHNASTSKPRQWLFTSCHFELNAYGVVPSNPETWTFIRTKFEQSTKNAVVLTNPVLVRFSGCEFTNNSTTDGTQQVLINNNVPGTPYTYVIIFEQCYFDRSISSGYDISVNSMIVKLFHCYFTTKNTLQNTNGEFEVDGISNAYYPDPVNTPLKSWVGWVTPSTTPKILGVFYKTSMDNSSIFIKDVVYHITEAFTRTGGNYIVASIGVDASAQAITQSLNIDNVTGVLDNTLYNNRGYSNLNNIFVKANVVTDGTLDNNGKILVTVTYMEVPRQP